MNAAAPTPRARELVRGAFDLHIHVDPDVVGRSVDDVTLAEQCRERGLAGFGLKSHYTSTAERARVVNRVVPGVRAIGAITLNAAVGGLNPLAVEIAAREGARIVWLPTVDAVNEASARDRAYPPGAHVPMWVAIQRELREAGMEPAPVAVVDDGGSLLPELDAVLAVVARHQLVLATGHLGRDEIFTVVDAALAAGVRDVVVTHPEFTSQDLSIADQQALAGRGALLERCFTNAPHRQVQLGARVRRHPRHRAAAQPALDRPRPAGEPAGRGRARAVRRPPARGRLHRGGGPDYVRGAVEAAGDMSRRMLVIGAHAADFVWRAGGAIAVATRAGGTAQVIALS